MTPYLSTLSRKFPSIRFRHGLPLLSDLASIENAAMRARGPNYERNAEYSPNEEDVLIRQTAWLSQLDDLPTFDRYDMAKAWQCSEGAADHRSRQLEKRGWIERLDGIRPMRFQVVTKGNNA